MHGVKAEKGSRDEKRIQQKFSRRYRRSGVPLVNGVCVSDGASMAEGFTVIGGSCAGCDQSAEVSAGAQTLEIPSRTASVWAIHVGYECAAGHKQMACY